METQPTGRMDRRTAIKWIVAAGAGAALLRGKRLLGADGPPGPDTGGYGTDPDVMKPAKPGDFWPLLLTAAELRAASALCDIVIPADPGAPGALGVGLPDFLDEWISAPYPDQLGDRDVVRKGLAWIDAESQRRHGASFADAQAAQREALVADLAPEAPPGTPLDEPARFFRRFRDLTAIGYYTTPAGMAAIGYVGNLPLARFDGPPASLVAKLGLSDEVKW